MTNLIEIKKGDRVDIYYRKDGGAVDISISVLDEAIDTYGEVISISINGELFRAISSKDGVRGEVWAYDDVKRSPLD